MVVASHQPAYLPWLGYVDKLLACDLFVLSDNTQMTERDFVNRNFVKTPRGPVRLTVPVAKGPHTRRIYETEIADRPWTDQHLATIRASYRRAPYFDALWPELLELYSCGSDFRFLDDLCLNHLRFWMGWLQIERPIVRAKELPEMGRNSERILGLCKHLGAATYYSGALGRDYLQLADFEAAGVDVVFQDFRHPVYPQLHGDFAPRMGVIDFAMNCGPIRAQLADAA